MEVISHWHPNITINIVDDHTPWVKGSVPPPLDQCRPPTLGLPTKPQPCLLGLLGLLRTGSLSPKLPALPRPPDTPSFAYPLWLQH